MAVNQELLATTRQQKPEVAAMYDGLKAGGANFVVHLPDHVLFQIVPLLESDDEIQVFACSREDEGIAMAAGAYLGGKIPVALMEGSGVGYAGLILARVQLQRTPLLLISAHDKALGEPFDFHGATRICGQGIMEGLKIPHVIIRDAAQIKTMVHQALVTVRGQKTTVGLIMPTYLMGGEKR